MDSITELNGYEPINPKLRLILISLGLVTIIGISIWLAPYPLSLYHQVRGGQILQRIFSARSNLYKGFACAQPALTDGNSRSQVAHSILHLQKAIEHNQKGAQAYLSLGRAYCLLGEPDEAVEAYQVFIGLRPSNPLGHLELGFTYASQGRKDKAVSAWKISGTTVDDFLSEADQLLRQEHFQDARLWYQWASWVSPDNPRAWLGIGDTYAASSNWEEAIQFYLRAWRYDPDTSATSLSNAYLQMGDIRAAEEMLREAIRTHPESPNRLQWWQNLGQTLISQEQWDEAMRVYQAAIEEFPNEIDLLISRGWVEYERGAGIQAAMESFQKAIELDDRSGKGYLAMGQLLNREGNLKEAAQWFQWAVERNPNSSWYALLRGNNLRESGDLIEAIDIYNEIIFNDPRYEQAYKEIAWAYYLNNQFEEAMTAVEQAIALSPTPNQWFLIRAGTIFEAAGKTDEALMFYREALSVNPSNSYALQGIARLQK